MKTIFKTPLKPQKLAWERLEDAETVRDPVQVYCRIRPMQSDADLSCVRIKNSSTVILTTPEMAVNYKLNTHKEIQYIFKHVFEPSSTQREVYQKVANPLIENLIKGKNGLLFTYGVTGSGKTYTMTGDIKDRGIMPRCLDALFKTISDYQAKKYIFKPDKLNGFEILSDADALLERQAEMNMRFVKGRRVESDPEIASQASAEPSSLSGVDEDNMYAVFVSYVEIYNNSVYDLLENGGYQKTMQSKIIREDANHNMFVHGVTEIEVKSVSEAIEAFQTGQKRKRMGHTILNAESSRSHSVFTIRLVQAPVDSQGEYVIQDKRTITVSQLSLVDLAGSERTNRTKNTGQRLREAGNINNSLMTLRTCLEYLRENQLTGSNKKIPYRDSKITHLFKNYFDGEGQVCMIVCINPRAEDYDETSQVMKFAEMTQEVQVARPTPQKIEVGLTSGRRKANQIFKTAVNRMNELGNLEANKLQVDLGLVYSLGPNFPEYKLNSPEIEGTISELIKFLEQRIEKRRILLGDFEARCDNFRMHLMQMDREHLASRAEIASMQAMLKQEKQRHLSLENKVIIHESSIDELNRKLRDREDQVRELQKQLNQKQLLLSQKEVEKEKQKKKYTTKMAVETDKMNRELEHKLREQRNKHREKIKIKEEKLKLVSDILKADDMSQFPKVTRSISSEDLAVLKTPTATARTETVTNSGIRTEVTRSGRAQKGVPVANIRHRRSRSTGERWLEHRSPRPVPLGTIFQPCYKNVKSVTKLTDVKDITASKTSKYCLISQEADTDGDVETNIFKGNVIPTCGGGAQVVFDDVECLKQKSPVQSLSPGGLKRPSNVALSEPILEEVASRCIISLEGHASKKPKV